MNYDGTVLIHFGIPGQKWGIRRYQNTDGSLTDAGKKRYAKLINKKEKINTKLTKLRKKQGKVDSLDRTARRKRYEAKASKYRAKSRKYYRIANGYGIIGALSSESRRERAAGKYMKYDNKYNKYMQKAETMSYKSEKVAADILKNEKRLAKIEKQLQKLSHN